MSTSIKSLSEEVDKYKRRALHWRAEAYKKDKEIVRLKEFIKQIHLELQSEVDLIESEDV